MKNETKTKNYGDSGLKLDVQCVHKMKGLLDSGRWGHRQVQSPRRPGRPRRKQSGHAGGQEKRARASRNQLRRPVEQHIPSGSLPRSLSGSATVNVQESAVRHFESSGQTTPTMSEFTRWLQGDHVSSSKKLSLSSTGFVSRASLDVSLVSAAGGGPSADRLTVRSTNSGCDATRDIQSATASFSELLAACDSCTSDVDVFLVRCGGAAVFEAAALAVNMSILALKARVLDTLRSSAKMKQLFEILQAVGGLVSIVESDKVWTDHEEFDTFFAKCNETAATISTNLTTDSSGKWIVTGSTWSGGAFILNVLAITLASSLIHWDVKSNKILTFHPCGKVKDGACKLGEGAASMVLIFNGECTEDLRHCASLRLASSSMPSTSGATEQGSGLPPAVAVRHCELGSATDMAPPTPLTNSPIGPSSIFVPTSLTSAKNAIAAMRSLVAEQSTPVVAIDCEWDRQNDEDGIAVIQLGWVDSGLDIGEPETRAIVLKMHGRRKRELRSSIIHLLADSHFLFIGYVQCWISRVQI